MPAATPPSNCFVSSNRGAIAGAIAVSPPMSAVSARPRASHLAARAAARRLPVVAEPVSQPLTPRRATWLVLRREAQRTEAEAQQLTQLHAQSPAGRRGHRPRAGLCHPRPPAPAGASRSLAHARHGQCPGGLATLCHGLREDYEAVKAGVTLPWSTGPVEGHINRLKMLKRQMFGRARLDLLSRRFLRAPRPQPTQAACPRAPAQTPAVAA